METRANYAIVGLFALIVIAAAFGFIYWMAQYGRGGPMDPAARTALTDLARAVEDHRYAVAPRVWDHADLEQRVATVLREASKAATTGTRTG